VSVAVDDRGESWVAALPDWGVPVVVARLPVGDALATCSDGAVLAIERKTPADLLNSLADKRLFPQLIAMRGAYRWSYLVVTGTFAPMAAGTVAADGRATGWSYAALQGALVTIQQDIGVPVLYCPPHDYAACVRRLADRRRDPLVVLPPNTATVLGDAEGIVASLPGVGVERAKALLGALGTPANVIETLTGPPWAIDGIPGVGPETRKRARCALGLRDGACLTVQPIDDFWPAERRTA
jgi:ERCC4-type nuclease